MDRSDTLFHDIYRNSDGVPVSYLYLHLEVQAVAVDETSASSFGAVLFRIIAVFLLLWLPGVLLLSFPCNWNWDNAVTEGEYNDLLYPIGLNICLIQPIFSTGMALTKPAVAF